MSVPQAAVVAAARGWTGTPWAHQGRTRWGLDCLGLIVVVGQELGLLPPGIDEPYDRSPDGFRLRREAERRLDAVPFAAAAPGLVALIAWRRYPMHCGILGDGPGYLTLIHAFAVFGSVVEHRNDLPFGGPEHRPRIVNLYSYRGTG